MNIEDVNSDTLDKILAFADDTFSIRSSIRPPELHDTNHIGGLFYESPSLEIESILNSVNRIGIPLTPFSWNHGAALSTDELLIRFRMVSEAVDFLLTSFIDLISFSEGRLFTEKLAKNSIIPSFSIRDDVYANLSGLAILLGIRQALGSLAGKRISVMWVYGSNFVLPSVAHFVILQGAKLGANMSLVTPDKFPVLNRVIRKSESYGGIEVIEHTDTFPIKADVVIPINWCRIEDFSHPERYSDVASEFRDWYLDDHKIAEDCLLISEPPLQMDVSVSKRLIQGKSNLISGWYNLVASSLVSTMRFVKTESNKLAEPIFLY